MIGMVLKTSLCVICVAVLVSLVVGPDALINKSVHIVNLPDGTIQGHELKSYKQASFYAFQEIPYASPPIGELRFKDAKPPKKWTGILDTTKNTKICMQLGLDDPRESEDCLYLNVYTPVNPSDVNKSQPLPVYVYVHGGFFCINDGTPQYIGPQFLIDYGIILVTMNYRLGAFGFLSTGDDVIPGNLGLKDQNLAIRWVKDNIQLFGGDPAKITLGGQSAAAAAVGHHLLSEKSVGLFRGVIVQSGTPLCGKMFQNNPRYFAFKLGSSLKKEFGNHNSSEELLKLLQTVSAEDIKKNSDLEIPVGLRNSVGNEDNRIWAPVEDGAFVKGPMHENLRVGHFNLVPVLMGITSEEQIRFDLKPIKPKAKYFDTDTSFLINGNLKIQKQNKQVAGKKLKSIYTNSSFEEDFGSFVRYLSDAKYTTAIARHADLQSKYTDVFFYQFSYHGVLNHNNVTVPDAGKTGHEEDTYYLFQKSFHSSINEVPEPDLITQMRLLTLWTNFIKYLDPTPSENPLLTGIKWPRVKSGKFLYLDISNTLQIEENPRKYQEWRKIYDEYADEFQITY